MNVLVTGGAGYIGSHMVRVLLRAGHEVTVVDDLRTGDLSSLGDDVAFIESRAHGRALSDQMAYRQIEAVMHFAASSIVADSIRDPAKYFQNNVADGIYLLKSCMDAAVRKFVFSSSAAVYGTNGVPRTLAYGPIDEDYGCIPLSVYGESKLMFENILARYSAAYDFRSVSLRYFNAAGAADGLRERHDPETHLIPLAIDAAFGQAPLTIYGIDYPTPDGTAVRDYIHVSDLCTGHLRALDYLNAGGKTDIFNLGAGVGTSVLQVISAIDRVCRRNVPWKVGPRREGDPSTLVASIDKARELLHWAPTQSLEAIIESTWESRRK